MRPELLIALQTISEGVTLLRAGNPNHKGSGPGGGQFTNLSGGGTKKGSGKNFAKRSRRKAKARKEAKSMRREHKAQRKNLLSDQKREWGRLQREHKSEIVGHLKAVKSERASLLSSQHSERSKLIEGYKSDPKEVKLQGVAGIKGELSKLRGDQKSARHELVKEHEQRLSTVKGTHEEQRHELKQEHREYRKDVREDQRKEKRLFIDELKGQRRIYGEVARQTQGLSRLDKPRFGKHRTHKANSAEAILKHVLRQRGWTAQYDGASLSGRQHLSLLDDVRQYSRMYLRHEAESFFDRYGVEVEEANEGPARSLVQVGMRENEIRSQVEGSVSRGLAGRAAGALSRFFDRTKHFIREIVVAGAMALKGDEPLTHAEIYALDRLTKKQYEYLDNFEHEVIVNPPREIADLDSVIMVEPAPMTPGQFIARLESYGNAPWEVQNVGRAVVKSEGVFSAERRVHLLSLEAHRPCKGGEMGCLEQSQLGWQPIGVLREIGDCFCMNNCDCYFEWQDPKGRIYVSPWGRHNPKGFNQPGTPGSDLPGIAYPTDQPAIPNLPSGPGPAEKPRKRYKLKPATKPMVPPKPAKSDGPPDKPDWHNLPNVPSLKELLEEAGSPFKPEEYEEA